MESRANQIRRTGQNRRQNSSNDTPDTCDGYKPSSGFADAVNPRFSSSETLYSRYDHYILEVMT